MICSESEVKKYLKETKGRIREHGLIFMKKAEEEIMRMGINIEIAKEIILKLDKKNYVRGPDKDLSFPLNNIWVFGSEAPTGFYEIYI